MLSLDKTDDGVTVCGRLARLMPNKSWFFSFLTRATEINECSCKAERDISSQMPRLNERRGYEETEHTI